MMSAIQELASKMDAADLKRLQAENENERLREEVHRLTEELNALIRLNGEGPR